MAEQMSLIRPDQLIIFRTAFSGPVLSLTTIQIMFDVHMCNNLLAEEGVGTCCNTYPKLCRCHCHGICIDVYVYEGTTGAMPPNQQPTFTIYLYIIDT